MSSDPPSPDAATPASSPPHEVPRPSGEGGATNGGGGEPPVAVPTGVLVVDKPVGPTSMQVITRLRGRVRRWMEEQAGGPIGRRKVRVGHAGTLDPLASGILLVGVGAATRELQHLMGLDKAYETDIDLSAFTPSDDGESDRLPVDVATPPDRAAIEAVLPEFVGDVMQRPPLFSAMKVDGKRAYELARAGDEQKLAARPIRVESMHVVTYAWPTVRVAIRCGKGFYVRSFARALGERLGTGGTCLTIRRTAIGPFGLDVSVPADDVPWVLGPEAMMSLAEMRRRVEPATDAGEAAAAGD